MMPAAVLAHPPAGEGIALAAGLLHPLQGADHLLAMVAVGIWAALSGPAARVGYPAAFLAAMLAGGLAAGAGLALPLAEPMILASVVLAGAAAAAALRVPFGLAAPVLALCGFAHGHAHGVEGPAGAGAGYAAGFLVATAALHLLGLAIGLAALRVGRPVLARAAGGVVALSGAALAVA
jgi:urease accessory protein